MYSTRFIRIYDVLRQRDQSVPLGLLNMMLRVVQAFQNCSAKVLYAFYKARGDL